MDTIVLLYQSDYHRKAVAFTIVKSTAFLRKVKLLFLFLAKRLGIPFFQSGPWGSKPHELVKVLDGILKLAELYAYVGT